MSNLDGENLKMAYSKLCEYYVEDNRNIESFDDKLGLVKTLNGVVQYKYSSDEYLYSSDE